MLNNLINTFLISVEAALKVDTTYILIWEQFECFSCEKNLYTPIDVSGLLSVLNRKLQLYSNAAASIITHY